MTKEQAEKVVETALTTTKLAKELTELLTITEEETGVTNCVTVSTERMINDFHLLYVKDVKALAENYEADVTITENQTYTEIQGIKFFSLNEADE